MYAGIQYEAETVLGLGSGMGEAILPSSALLQALDRDPSVLYVLNEALRIVYYNHAWRTFEETCEIGTSIFEHIAEPLRDFYRRAFDCVKETGFPWRHTYECSTEVLYRRYRLQILPVEKARFLVVSSFLEAEYPHADGPQESCALEPNLYRGGNGMIVICANCRRTRHPADPNTWEWVPGHAGASIADLSHGLCPLCLLHFVG